jgi:hypothetical protein
MCLGIRLLPLCAQEPGAKTVDWRNSAPRVYLDGSSVDRDYVLTEIPFVSYVRDRTDAEIHILTTAQYGEAGTEYLIEFIGRGKFQDIHFTLKFFSDRLFTEDEEREGYVRVLKKGLMPFLARTDLEGMLAVSFKEKANPAPIKDPWDRWLFSLSVGGSSSGEKYYGSNSYRGGFSVNRVTEDLKVSASFNTSVNKSRFTFEDVEVITETKNWRAGSLVVKSLGDHWAVGGWVQAASSTYSNEAHSFRLAPALEYNLFPYSQATRKELRVLYRLNYSFYRYFEETIYGKLAEHLWSQSLNVSLEVRQPWGSVSAAVIGSHYFHDFSKNRVSLFGSLSFRVWKGFSFYVSGDYEMVHDQLSIAKGDLTDEEIFLRLKQLATTYSYYISVGISYSFGSSLRGAVNPRFGESYYY